MGTARASGEEGGDDVKSARPLRPGRHTCYNGRYRGEPGREAERIPKAVPSSDRSLQPDSVKLDSLVIAHQPWRGEYVPGPCSRTGRCGWNTSFLERDSLFTFLAVADVQGRAVGQASPVAQLVRAPH